MSAAVVVFAVCAAGCVVAHLAILRSVVRHRSAVGTTSPAEGNRIPRPNLLVEIVWALVPIVALAFLLTATWNQVRARDHATAPVMMKVAE